MTGTQLYIRLLGYVRPYWRIFAVSIFGMLIAAVTEVVTVLIRDSVTILALLAYLLWLNWSLTLITFIMIPPIALVVRAFNRRLRGLTRQTQQAMGDIN